MRKFFVFVALLLSVAAFAQSNVTTGRVQFTATTTQNDSVVVNSTQGVWQVLNQGMLPTGSCVNTPIGTRPAVVQPYNPNAYSQATAFQTNMGFSWSFPTNVSITQLTVRICYHLNGNVPLYSILVPILKDTTNGDIYEPESGGTTIFPGNYTPTTTTPASSFSVTWNLSGWPLSSNDLYNGRFELGYRVKNYPPPWVLYQPPVADAVRIHGIEIKGSFVSTYLAPFTPTPSISYTPPYANGSVAVTITMPAPSSATGVILAVLCNSGNYENMGSIAWGANANLWNQRVTTRSFSMNALRLACTQQGTTLNQNSTTRVRARLYTGSGNGFGTDEISNSIVVY